MAAPVQKPRSAETLEQRFRRLEERWRTETKVLSDPSKIMSHPAMREIVAMGEEVVPFVLCALQANDSLLVWALPEIVGVDLVPPRTEGGFKKWDVRAQIEAWLE